MIKSWFGVITGKKRFGLPKCIVSMIVDRWYIQDWELKQEKHRKGYFGTTVYVMNMNLFLIEYQWNQLLTWCGMGVKTGKAQNGLFW